VCVRAGGQAGGRVCPCMLGSVGVCVRVHGQCYHVALWNVFERILRSVCVFELWIPSMFLNCVY